MVPSGPFDGVDEASPEELRQRLHSLHALIENAPVPIAIAHDPACRSITANRALAALLHLPATANISLTPPLGESPAYRIQRHGRDVPSAELPMQYAIAHRARVTNEIEIVRADGSVLYVQNDVEPLFDTTGQIYGCVSVCVDLTDRKLAEIALREADRRKDEFLATLSHELRTPLNAVLGWAVTLRTAQLDAATRARALEAIERNARAQSQLIEDLLDISRIVTGKLRLDVRLLEPIVVVEAALDAMRPAARAKDIEITTALEPRTGPVYGDPDRLQQVVLNLLTNAIKFTGKGGRIDVELTRTASHVEISIGDSGQGIPPAMLPYVFDRFRQADGSSTRRQGGLGIGLALVRTLTELHGGTAVAESAGEGRGATFRVRLPLAASAESAGGSTTAERALAGRPLAALEDVRVLVLEDDRDTLELFVGVLRLSGADVRGAHCAAEALETLVDWRPDVLVCDIEMPGTDGYAFIRRVRARPAEQGGAVPAVAITAHGSVQDRFAALAAGFQMHVPKPVEPAELVAVVANVARPPAAG
jgi:signal transduction histidine kinase/ActR/RegA family two-component response regulator